MPSEKKRIKFTVYKFSPSFSTGSFDCGSEPYNTFIVSEALDYQKRNLGVTYVFLHEETLAGYVTISMGSLNKQKLPDDPVGRKPRYIPALFLGRLARDNKYKGLSVGDQLLDWVLTKAKKLSKQLGCRLVLLESEERARSTYERSGFILIPPSRRDPRNIMFFDLGENK